MLDARETALVSGRSAAERDRLSHGGTLMKPPGDTGTPLAGAAGSANHWWAVAVVLLQSGRQGVVKLTLRHGLWLANSKDAAISAAVSEALKENPGWTMHLVNATGMPPNAERSATAGAAGAENTQQR